MRRGEILALRWLDVDLANRVINLPQSKTGRGRTVYLNEAAMNVFRSLPLDLDSESAEPVFSLETTPEELSMCFMRACRAVGIQDFRFHDLRHTHATWLRQSGVQLDQIAKQLGHSDLRMTMRYSHLGQTQVREAVDRLDSIESNPKATEAETPSTENRVTRLN
jgi:integrase